MQHRTISLENALEIPLFPGAAGNDSSETIVERSTDPMRKDRAVSEVSSPSLFMYRPEKPNGASMLILPGGGFHRISIDKEGVDIAGWLSSIGITPFILKYRFPDRNSRSQRTFVSIDDAIRAMRVIRHNAGTYGISRDRIGAMGFSAGGYILARMSCCPADAGYTPVDSADDEPFRPALIVLMYSLVTLSPPYTHKISREILVGETGDECVEKDLSIYCNIKEDSPPVFIVHSQDDASVSVENSIMLYRALLEKGISADMHLFHEGGHGFGIHKVKGLPAGNWTVLCEQWMNRNGFSAN
jgi:acetyl esterase/lipase